MRGQGLAPGPHLGRDFWTSGVSNRFRRSLRGLQFFQFQLELFQLDDNLLCVFGKPALSRIVGLFPGGFAATTSG